MTLLHRSKFISLWFYHFGAVFSSSSANWRLSECLYAKCIRGQGHNHNHNHNEMLLCAIVCVFKCENEVQIIRQHFNGITRRRKKKRIMSLFQMTGENRVSLLNTWLCIACGEAAQSSSSFWCELCASTVKLNSHHQLEAEIDAKVCRAISNPIVNILSFGELHFQFQLKQRIFTYQFKFWWSNSSRINSSFSCLPRWFFTHECHPVNEMNAPNFALCHYYVFFKLEKYL